MRRAPKNEADFGFGTLGFREPNGRRPVRALTRELDGEILSVPASASQLPDGVRPEYQGQDTSEEGIPRVSVAVPVLNEAGNTTLVDEIAEALDGRSSFEVIFVNDGSSEGKGRELGGLMGEGPLRAGVASAQMFGSETRQYRLRYRLYEGSVGDCR